MAYRKKSYRLWGMVLIVLVIVFAVLDLLTGSVNISLAKSWEVLTGGDSTSTAAIILMEFRLPRVITCLLTGAALSSGGLMMQTLFRNPLAGPDVLGLTSGAGLMVALLLMGGTWPLAAAGSWGIAAAAITGSSGIFLIVMTVARKMKDHATLLIVGLMIAAATSSLVSVLQYVSQSNVLKAYTLWSMGNVDNTAYDELMVMGILTVPALLLSLTLMKPLNALLWGENYAASMGIRVKRSRLMIIAVTSVLTGVSTAFCGPIAFIGIAVPHLVKFLVPTTDHKTLMLQVMAGGALIMLVCDVIRQLVSAVQPLPLNAVTSLIGAPVVIWVVVKHKNLRRG